MASNKNFHLILCVSGDMADRTFKRGYEVLNKYFGHVEASQRTIKTDTDEFRFVNSNEIHQRGVRPDAIKPQVWFEGYLYGISNGVVGIPTDDLNQEPRIQIYHTSREFIRSIIEHQAPRGKFLARSGLRWVAVDNTTGDAWTEEFFWKSKAIKWLKDSM